MWSTRAIVSLWIAALAGVVLLLVGAAQALVADVPAGGGTVEFVRSAEAVPVATALGGVLVTAVFGLILLVGHRHRRW